MTAEFNRMRQLDDAAYKAEKNYLDKLREYNRGIFELKSNIQKIILPTEEAKLKASQELKTIRDKEPIPPKTDADKAIEQKELLKDKERHDKLNAETHGLIRTLTNKLSR